MDNGKMTRETFTKAAVACVISVASLAALSAGDYPTPVTSGLEFEPGQYTASAKGMESDVVVTCTFDETMLTDISIDVSGETDGIGAAIGDEMSDKVLQAQSAEIDGVAGASVTSEAIKAAVAACIAQATGEEPAAAETQAEEAAETQAEEAEETQAETDAPAAEEETESAAEESNDASAGEASYVPGEYTASAQGMESEVKVTAVFDESSITEFTVDVSGETAGIGAEIADEITEQILAAQSAEVDGISGATVSSNAVKTATEDVIAQASGGAAPEAAEETEVAETEEETAAAETEEETAAAETEAETEASEAETELAEAETELIAEEASIIPGEYTASAQGMESEVEVTITFDENGMTDVSVDVSGETKGIGAEIGDRITAQILEAQSADIDGITGATVTSSAVKAAVEEILAQAAGAETEEETELTDGGAYLPGEYTASAQGMESEVLVAVTVDESAITDVVIDVSGETAGIGAAIGDEVTEQILSAQGSDIDGVSGATVTSNAVKTALEDALSQASGK